MIARPLLLAACIALSACSGLQQLPDTQEEIVSLAEFTSADLREALADARAHNDLAAMQCYAVLIERIDALPGLTATRVIGAVTAFQKARNIRRRIDEGVSEEVHIACAALVSDARNTILRLGRVARKLVL